MVVYFLLKYGWNGYIIIVGTMCCVVMFTAESRLYILLIKETIMDAEKAYLSNDKEMIQFRYGDKIIRFRGPYSLERFDSCFKGFIY